MWNIIIEDAYFFRLLMKFMKVLLRIRDPLRDRVLFGSSVELCFLQEVDRTDKTGDDNRIDPRST